MLILTDRAVSQFLTNPYKLFFGRHLCLPIFLRVWYYTVMKKQQEKKTINRIFRFIPMIIIMALIFLFSAMQGDESSQTSGVFLKAIERLFEEVTHKGLTEIAIDNLHHIIRKCAHFTEYAFLGASIMFAIWDKWKEHKAPVLLPELIAMLYATTDEIHQYFVPGRYGTWTDVLIDSTGAITGIFIYWLIYRRLCKKNKKS